MATSRKPYSRSKFTSDEDVQLRNLVAEYGPLAWVEIANLMPDRNARQCRERWKHYLSNDQASLPWTEAEDALLFQKISELGPKWTRVATLLGNRSDIEIKMRWLKKFNHILRILPKSQRDPEMASTPAAPRPPPPPVRPSSPVQAPAGSTAELVSVVEEFDEFGAWSGEEHSDLLSQWESLWGSFI
jgi:hypothetical protein